MADDKEKKTPKKADAAAPAGKKPEAAKKPEGTKKPAKTEAKPAGPAEVMPKDYVPRLRKHYDEVVKPKLIAQFGYKNVMEVPKLTKIVLNMGIGEATQDSKLVQVAASELEKIAGQKVVITKSRKAIAQFKIRENLAIGAKVTLRKVRMYEFLDTDHHRPAAGARLPRVDRPELRRQWQLRHGHQGTSDFPGNRLRQDRSRLGHGCDRLHLGANRRRGARLARGIQLPIPQVHPQAGGVRRQRII